MMVVIAVTGLPGAGSSTIAKLLAKKLKLRYFSPGEYFKSHSRKKTQTERVLSVFQSGKGKQKLFHKRIDEMQIELAKKGNVVICGKLSIVMLKNIADYKVWLECSIEGRTRRTAKRDKIGLDLVKEKIRQREKMEMEEWKKDYGFDYRRQREMADIVVDSTKLIVEQTVDKILKFMKSAQK